MAYKTGKKARKAALLLVVNLFFILLCFLVLIPVLYAFSVSLNADNSLLSSDFSFLPKHMTLANYRAVFVEEPILRWFSNSIWMAAAAVFISLGTGIPAAYVFPGKVSGKESYSAASDSAVCISGAAFHDGFV